MEKIISGKEVTPGLLKVIAARRLDAGKQKEVIRGLQKWLRANQMFSGVSRMPEIPLPCLQRESDTGHRECWLTLSEELDGIRYLDIYETE